MRSCLVHTHAWRLTFNSVSLKRSRLTTTDLSLPGRMSGADEFLPMMTYVLAQCDIPQLDNEILYMMELLDPSQLNGEGTSLVAALCSVILERERNKKINSCYCL